MRCDSEEFVVAGYNGDARAEVNQSFEYVGKSVPCEHLSSITSTHPLYPVPPVERLHFSFKRTALKLCFSLGDLSLAPMHYALTSTKKSQIPSRANGA